MITANDLKTRGVSALEQALSSEDETIISVHGKPRYVVMAIEHYERLREAELLAGWSQVREAVDNGDYVVETAEQHIERLNRELPEDNV